MYGSVEGNSSLQRGRSGGGSEKEQDDGSAINGKLSKQLATYSITQLATQASVNGIRVSDQPDCLECRAVSGTPFNFSYSVMLKRVTNCSQLVTK